MARYKVFMGTILCAAALWLAGCDSRPNPALTATATVPPTPTAEAGKMEVTYLLAGGFPGYIRELKITSEGLATLKDKGTLVGTLAISPAALSELRAKVDEANFFQLEKQYGTQLRDGTVNVITVTQGLLTKEVTIADGSEGGAKPQALLDLIATLRGISKQVLAQAQPTETPLGTTTPATPTTPPKPGSIRSPTGGSGRPTPPVAGWNAKITYEKSGGVAGIKQTLLVGPSGQARLTEGSKNSGPVRLSAERLAKVKAKLDDADFFNLKERYGNGNVADDFVLTISITQDNRTRTVAVEQEGGKGVTPQALLDLIGELDALKGEIAAGSPATGTPATVATP